MSPSVMQLAWKSEDWNLGVFSPQQALSKQHCLPEYTQSCFIFPPHPDPGSAQAIPTLRIWICHIGWPFPGQREGKRCPGRGLGVSTPWSTVGGNGGWAASNQLGTLPWVLSLAQNCREEKERPQRRKTPHRVRAKQEDNKQEEPRRGESATTRLSEGPDITDCHRKCLCGRT